MAVHNLIGHWDFFYKYIATDLCYTHWYMGTGVTVAWCGQELRQTLATPIKEYSVAERMCNTHKWDRGHMSARYHDTKKASRPSG